MSEHAGIDELMAHMDLGDQAEKFLDGDLGRVLCGIARQQAEEAKAGLVDVDPTDSKAVSALQDKVRWAASFEQWLVDLVQKGQEAYNALRERTEGV